jgi:hypothetical protein
MRDVEVKVMPAVVGVAEAYQDHFKSVQKISLTNTPAWNFSRRQFLEQYLS